MHRVAEAQVQAPRVVRAGLPHMPFAAAPALVVAVVGGVKYSWGKFLHYLFGGGSHTLLGCL